jgi:KDO2-lipid IV(A) lauroyltransferase
MILLHFLDFFVWLMPVWLSMWAGRRLGTLFYWLDRKHRKIAFDNLKKAFPEYTMPQIEMITLKTFQHLVLLGIEVLILSRKSPSSFRDRVFDEGLLNLEKAKAQGKSILFLTGHVGNWELLAKLGRWAGFIESVIARDVKSKKVQLWIESVRARYGVQVISKGQIRHIVRELRNGRTVGALIDQDGGRRGTFVPFFGRPASTPAGVIRLGLRLGIPILPAFLRRVSDRMEYRCLIGEDVTIGLENLSLQEKEKIALERFAHALEKFIREDPSQWLWLHRRWKTRPVGESSNFQKRVLLLNDGKAGHFNQVLGVFKGLNSWEGKVCPVQFRSRFHRAVFYAGR